MSFKYTDSIQRPGARAQGLGKMMTNTEVSAQDKSRRLFNLYIEDLEEGVKVGRKLIKVLIFADGKAIVVRKEEDLQRMMDRLNKTTTEYGMQINTKKTKLLKIRRVVREEKNNYENNNRQRRNRTGHRVLLYGAETWTMRKEDVKRIEAFKMWI